MGKMNRVVSDIDQPLARKNNDSWASCGKEDTRPSPSHARTYQIYHAPRGSSASTPHETPHLTFQNQVHPRHSGIKVFPVRPDAHQCLGQSQIFSPIVTAGKYPGELAPRSRRFQFHCMKATRYAAGTLTSINEIANDAPRAASL